MAVLTAISLSEAKVACEANGLGDCEALHPVAAGSVNSNFFVDTPRGRFFLRVYEEQETDGVAYEWALIDHLVRAGLPVPRRVGDVAPGAVRLAGKPTAFFELAPGQMSCQRAVDEPRLRELGAVLGRCHRAGQSFGWRRPGRFDERGIAARLDVAERADRPELRDVLPRLRSALARCHGDRWPGELPRGAVHTDMFRDNVLFDGARITAVIDWESACDHALLYDLAVVILAWCYGDGLDWTLARALVDAYAAERPLLDVERGAFPLVAGLAAVRFSATRITDFHLREGSSGVRKDYRRFLDRLTLVESLDEARIRDALF